jgi:hypothetical protein
VDGPAARCGTSPCDALGRRVIAYARTHPEMLLAPEMACPRCSPPLVTMADMAKALQAGALTGGGATLHDDVNVGAAPPSPPRPGVAPFPTRNPGHGGTPPALPLFACLVLAGAVVGAAAFARPGRRALDRPAAAARIPPTCRGSKKSCTGVVPSMTPNSRSVAA